jgi:two-component system, OmpR family, sensor kinase
VSLRARLVLALSYVLVLAVLALLVPLVVSVRDRVDAEVRSQARSQAELAAAVAAGTPDLDRVVRRVADAVRGRVIVVGRRGLLVADSAAGSEPGDDYSTRPEVRAALAGRTVQEERASDTLGRRILATAVPVVRGGRADGAVRITQSVEAVRRAVNRATLGLGLIGGVVLLLGLAAGVLIAGQVARPLRSLEATARRVAAGDLGARARVEGSSEQQVLARTFNDMTARVERLVESQREFVADASHQLRTPLAGLRLRLEEALAGSIDADSRDQLEAGLREVDRLAAMVSELLVLSHAGEQDAPADTVDASAAAHDVSARFRGAADAQGMTLEVRDEHDGERVSIARADLDRVLDVLVENALAYGPPGQRVVIAAHGSRIEVIDEGTGLASGEEEAVFDRFHRGSAGRQGPHGTGLGLAIARELAGRHGGEVALERLPEGGTRAVVLLRAATLAEA